MGSGINIIFEARKHRENIEYTLKSQGKHGEILSLSECGNSQMLTKIWVTQSPKVKLQNAGKHSCSAVILEQFIAK